MDQNLSSITRPRGFLAAGGTCGIKASGKPDLALIACERPARLAAVFTTNAVVGAPVLVGREHVRGGRGRAFVVNSGCSNVATGQRGLDDARTMAAAAAEAIGCRPTEVLPASTGVIGHHLPIDRIVRGVAELGPKLAAGPRSDADAAHAILTTDLTPKAARRCVTIDDQVVEIGGIAKGSGMIAPNMATMLAFLTTDADLSAPMLRRALKRAVNADASFNRISVDSDTSTSDTVAILASGLAGHQPIREPDSRFDDFTAGLTALCQDLAYQVIRDGEGAEHVIRVVVEHAGSEADALRAARAVADSPLVKTAVHGGDPNWGRIAMAVGKSGAQVNPARMSIRIGPTPVYREGRPTAFDEAEAAGHMAEPEVRLTVDLGLGAGRCEFLGCDLSRQYIAINADYTT
jgi:glutamate N-acetyltransferase/amino-acid N-acetyltransferase